MTTIQNIAVASVARGKRHRKDMGDIAALAASLAELGMLQPIGITPAGTLVFGERRLTAAESLGWGEVPAIVFDSLADAVAALKAERDENRCRKEMTPSEYVELGRALEEVERVEARKRMKSGTLIDPVEPVPQGQQSKTRDRVGAAVGVSGRTYEQAKKVVDTAPELVEAMDKKQLSVKTAAKVADLPAPERKKVAKAADPKKAAKKALERAAEGEPEPDDPADAAPEPPKGEPAPEPLKDGLGNAVPRALVDTFGDPMLAEAVARIDAAHRELISVQQHVLKTLSRKGDVWPYAHYGECAKSLAAAADRLAEASRQLADGIPFCACPHCRGEGCPECRQSGAWPRHRYENRTQYGDAA